MAIENIVKLLEVADAKPELTAKLEGGTDPEQVVQIGAEEGLDFTTEEAETFRQKLIELQERAESGEELTDDELEETSGGVIPQFLFRVATTDTQKEQDELMTDPNRFIYKNLVPGGGYIYDGMKATNGSLTGIFTHAGNAVYNDVKSVAKKVFSGW